MFCALYCWILAYPFIVKPVDYIHFFKKPKGINIFSLLWSNRLLDYFAMSLRNQTIEIITKLIYVSMSTREREKIIL